MIQSANETSYVIAENISPTRHDFYNLMNSRAKELGAQNTNFLNPCGIDNGKKGENHLTTASDLAKIARHAMTLPEFREIVQKTTYKVPPTNKHPNEVTVFTTNRLLTYGKYKSEYYDKITGIKTGYTDRAGFNLVSGAQTDDGMELIAVVMGVRDAYENVFNYSKTLLEYGFKNYSIKQVVAPRESISQVTVSDAYNPYLSLIAAKDIRSVLPNYTEKLDELIQKEIKINKNISAPIKEGDVLGSMEVKFNDVVLGNVDLIASRDVKKLVPSPAPVSVMQKTFSNPIFRNVVVGAIVILLLFTTLRITLKRISRTIKSRRTN
jgi:D-alanyl-D-alanine carboxypeptidase/D-alanyl-D-alanine carboxypeptidase (penicillin-binding protein 5/6)